MHNKRLPHPLAPPNLAKLPGGSLLLLTEPHLIPVAQGLLGTRFVIAAQVSHDSGRTWTGYRELQYTGGNHTQDYASIFVDGEMVHITHYRINCTDHCDNQGKRFAQYIKLPASFFLSDSTADGPQIGRVANKADDETEISVGPTTLSADTFWGVGGASGGGGGTRLLVDYPEQQRSGILDMLFKPQYGASLQHLKVEVGCDGDTTQGSEPTHARSATDIDFDRGYEVWFMEEAAKRRPDIQLSGLEWGIPGWVAADPDGFFGKTNVDYLTGWVTGLRDKKGLNITACKYTSSPPLLVTCRRLF